MWFTTKPCGNGPASATPGAGAVGSRTRAMADVAVFQRVGLSMSRAKLSLDNGGGVKLISHITTASPAVVTALGHGYSTGDWITILNVRGMAEANALWRITVIDDSSFSLDGSTMIATYTGGGYATRSPIPEFDFPLACALSFMRVNMSNPITPGDADVACLSPYQWQELIDIAEAEFFAWLSVAASSSTSGGFGIVEEQLPDYRYRKDPQATMHLSTVLAERMAKVQRLYFYNVAVMRYGSIDHGYQADGRQHRAAHRGGE
jgi:hypothetical protein